jgi:hypothetical protein
MKRSELGFWGPDRRVVLLLRESRIAIDLRWTAHDVLGSIRPWWESENVAQAQAFARNGLSHLAIVGRFCLRILSFGPISYQSGPN